MTQATRTTVSPLDYPALDSRPVTQGHTDQCALRGHAQHLVAGKDTGRCPRCGEVKPWARVTLTKPRLTPVRVLYASLSDSVRELVTTVHAELGAPLVWVDVPELREAERTSRSFTPWYLIRPHGRCPECNRQWPTEAHLVTSTGGFLACPVCTEAVR